MEFHYLLIIGILAIGVVYGFTKYKSNEKLYTYLILLFLSIFPIFRDYTVGNDTYEYVRVFDSMGGIGSLLQNIQNSRYEVGYVILSTVIRTFTDNYSILLMVVTIIYMTSVGRFINKYSKNKWISIMLFYVLGNYFLIFNILRQCVAMSIFLYSIDYLVKGNIKKYVMFIFLALSFHTSALIFFILIPVSNRKFNFKSYMYIISLTVLFILMFDKLMLLIVDILPQYSSYYIDSKYSKGGIRLASIVSVVITVILLLVSKVSNKMKCYREYKDDKINNLFEIITLLNLVILILSMKFNLLDRVAKNLSLISIVYFSNATSRLGKYTYFVNYTLIALFIIYCTLVLYIRPEWNGIMPFKFKSI